MTNTNTPTQFWIVSQTYHGTTAPSVWDNRIHISSAPFFRGGEVHLHNIEDTDFSQYGPFSTIGDARREMRHLYGTCRRVDAPCKNETIARGTPEYRNVLETYLYTVYNRPMRISIDNGHTWETADELFENERFLANEPSFWTQIEYMMDDDTREQVAAELAPCTNLEFLRRYLEIAEESLCIG